MFFLYRKSYVINIILLVITLVAFFASLGAAIQTPENRKEYESNEYSSPRDFLIKINPEKFGSNNESLIPKAYAGQLKETKSRDWVKVSVLSDQDLVKIRNTEGVEKVVPDYKRRKLAPNDSYYNSQNNIINGQFDQWNLRQIGFNPTAQTSAWNTTTGSSETIIAVLDTGVDLSNPDITGGSGSNWSENNIWINQQEIPNAIKVSMDTNNNNIITSVEMILYFSTNNLDVNLDGVVNFLDMVSNGSPLLNNMDNNSPPNGYEDDIFGYNFGSGISNINDPDGHGTHVFGTIGAVTDNNVHVNPGIAGICWYCKIMPLRVTQTTSGFEAAADSDIVDAIDYAINNGAKVINISLGGPNYSPFLESAIVNAWDNGVLVVSAAGNDGGSASDNYPGGSRGTLAIGASDYQGSILTYSNKGNRLDIVAPGENILSTSKFSNYSCIGAGHLQCYSGTSMATPHVTGVAALLFDLHKNDPSPWTPKDVRAALLTQSSNLFSTGFDEASGFGRVNAISSFTATSLTVDNLNPIGTLTSFPNPLKSGTIAINGTASDTNLYIYTISFARTTDNYIVKQVSGRNSITDGILTNIDTTFIDDGTYNITMYVEDFYGNFINSNIIPINIDNTSPSVFTAISPLNNSFTINPTPTFTWTPSADGGSITYDFILNGNVIASDLSITSFTPGSNLPNGIYNWSVNAKDSAGNSIGSGTFTLTIDTVPPNPFTVNISINGTVATYTFSATDNTSGISHYQVYIDNNSQFVTVNSPYSPGAQSVGEHSVKVRAIDKAGNYIDSLNTYTIIDICAFRKTKADFNCDGSIEVKDLSILASNWLRNTSNGDTNNDGVVDVKDLSILASNWLKNI